VSPDGRRVFVTGASSGGRLDRDDFDTVAYSAATGKQLWASRYNGPGKLYDEPAAIAVSPDGRRVFVTGLIPTPYGSRAYGQSSDYATLAYNATTGKQLWASRYNNGTAISMAVSGSSETRTAYDYVTIAYRSS
jgi:outer membrane protein assembly factor BamB